MEMQIQSEKDDPKQGQVPPLPKIDSTADVDMNYEILKSFFSLTGGSIFYCLSALSIIYGIAKILGPLLTKSVLLSDAMPCLAALNIYEIAMMSVLALIVVWQNVRDDAVSLVVLVALFLVGSGMALTTVSENGTNDVLGIGIFCMIIGAVKLYILRRYIRLYLPILPFAGLMLIIAWNFTIGGLLGRQVLSEAVSKSDWLVSWLVLLAGGVLVFANSFNTRPDNSKKAAFLVQPPMLWIFSMIILIAATVHQYTVGYIFDVSSEFGDYLPLASLIILILLRMSRYLRQKTGNLEMGLALLPLLACCAALIDETMPDSCKSGIGLLWYPPVTLSLTAAGIIAVAIKTDSMRLMKIIPFYLLGIILTIGFSPSHPADLNWKLVGILLAAGCFIYGLIKKNPTICAVAIFVAAGGAATTRTFDSIIQTLNIQPEAGIFGFFGLGIMILALIFPKIIHKVLFIIGALALMRFLFSVLSARTGMGLEISIISCTAFLCAGLWIRTGFWPVIVILCIPIGFRLFEVFQRMSAWRYIVISFALLFVGAWISIEKGKKQKHEEDAEPERQDETNS